MDIGKSFMYVTQDQDWIKKVLIGGLITLIPIVGPFFAFGYVLATMKNVIAEQEVPLPEIGDFGGKLVEGGTVMDYTTADEYRVALVEEGALYSVVLYLPFDVAPGQIELRSFDKSASPYGPTATVVSGAFSYLAEGGTVAVESVGNGTITGSFAFAAAHEMDAARRVTATGAFSQVPLVKK